MNYLEISVEDELQELHRRAEEMENNPMVCIPHKRVKSLWYGNDEDKK